MGQGVVRGSVAVALLAALLLLSSCQGGENSLPIVDEPVGTTAAALSGDSGSDAGPASPSIGSFAVYVTEAIEMNSGALVTGCNVGVQNTTGPFLGGGAAAYFNSGATIQSTQTLYAYSTYLNSGVSLGPLDTNVLTAHSGSTHGTVSTFPAMPAPPSTPSATAGTTSVTLNSGQSRTLAAGAYAGVTVNSGATLSLTGGTYVFSSLTLNSNATMAVSAATTVSVTGSGSFNSGSFAGPASGSGLTAKSLVLYFDGSSAINLNSGALLQALVVATSAKVTVNTSGFTGAIAAAQLVMNSGATVTCQDGFGSLVSSGDLCAGVTCTASDQCHVSGVCNSSTGVCSNPTASNGTACDDGNACTLTDACESGVCTGSNPVTCTAAGQCYAAGTCSPSTGTCSTPTLANGTACDDGNACTQTDQCESGTCVGSSPLTCTASSECTVAGTCSPSTGVCSNPPAANGTTCSDGNACTAGDSCQGGSCVGGPPVVCVASDTCHLAGTCSSGDGGTGGCSNPVASSGTSCSAGQCGGTCNATGTCVQTASAQNACYTSSCSPDAGVTTSPNSCVPTLNGTVATNIASMVAGGAVNAVSAVIVRGRVLGLPAGTPLAGAMVSILGHPEFTPSITAADGTYAVAINGGAQVTTVAFAGPAGSSFLPVQRHTPSQWQQYAVIPDVYLTPLDPNANDVALSSSTWQAAHGSTITDPADTVSPTLPHTARLFFPAGTTASFEYGACANTCATGTCTSGECIAPAPAALTVRLTEYTVGATGMAAMPAELPPSTGYTYAVDMSSDEAIAAGAGGVLFNQPV